MNNILKLFILTEEHDTVGRLLLDLDVLHDLQQNTTYPASNQDPSTNDRMIRKVSQNLAWYKRPDGTIYLQFIPR